VGVDDQVDGSAQPGAPEHERSGPTVEDAVATAEAGSQVEGDHTPIGRADVGESRLEQMADVAQEGTATDASGGAPTPGPTPSDIGSGGAQRIEGARISDRVAGGEPVPDGPDRDR
jgi:hypothetical protein